MAFRALEGAAAARASLESGFTTLRDLDSEGADFADVAVRDAIAQGLIPGPRAVLEKVRELDQLPGRCLKTCLIELAGAMKLHEATRVLVECLGDPDDDELAEAAAKSLSRLGAPSVVRQIRTQYPDKPWDFRLFAIGALQPIKTGSAETTLQALLEIEDDPALRGRIFDALRFHFTQGAAACMRAEIQEPSSWMLADELKKALYVNAVLLGRDDPQAEAWVFEDDDVAEDGILFHIPVMDLGEGPIE